MENKQQTQQIVKAPTYNVEGGIGKHIMFTSLIPALVRKSGVGAINIVSPYPDVYVGIPGVQGVFTPDAVGTEDLRRVTTDLIYSEPYKGNFSLYGDKHLLEYWANELGVEYSPDNLPQLPVIPEDLTKHAESIAEELVDFILVQFTGGQSPVDFNPKESQYHTGLMHEQRNYPIPFVNVLLQKIHAKYPDLAIVDYSLPNEHPKFPHTTQLELPSIAYNILAKHAKAIICIDSSLCHMAAANNKPAIALYGGIPAWQFGWKIHTNLTNFKGKIQEFNPFDPYYISIDSNTIIAELDKQLQSK